nr:copia protein [Tanacetum cinerariifolium]
MGELTFFLGLQVKQKKDGIFISQDKYVDEILTKFGLSKGKSASTPIDAEKPLLKDSDGEDVDVHTYRFMIGSLMYLTSSRPDIMFAYPKDSPFDLVAYSDSDYAGASLDRKSTTGGCQFLGCRLISWQCKKQTVVATSSTEAEYVAAASGYAQVLWMQNQLLDYGFFIIAVQTPGSGISILLAVGTPSTGSGNLYCQWELSPVHFIRNSDGPKWLFNIDALTKSRNYVPVVADDDSSSKNANNDKPQPFSDAGKKNDDGVAKESEINDQRRLENSTKDVNTSGPSINTVSTNVNTCSLNINIVSPSVTIALLEATHADLFGDETEVDMSNISITYPVPSPPNTRIYKDHSLDHVIGDVQSGVQTRRMTKTTSEQGFISAVYEGKNHKDIHTYLFAYFLSQEEPKKVIQALKDPS